LAVLGRLPSARVDGGVMQASEKPAHDRTIRARRVLVEEFARVGIDMEKITRAFEPKTRG